MVIVSDGQRWIRGGAQGRSGDGRRDACHERQWNCQLYRQVPGPASAAHQDDTGVEEVSSAPDARESLGPPQDKNSSRHPDHPRGVDYSVHYTRPHGPPVTHSSAVQGKCA